MSPRRPRLVLAAVLALAAAPAPALAALGDPDATYGDGGSVPLAVPRTGLVVADPPLLAGLRLTAPGRLQVVGTVEDGRRAVLARLRYRVDGTRLAGADGTATVPLGNGSATVVAAAAHRDGEVVAALVHTGRGPAPVLARLTAGGALDAGFGQGGIVALPAPPGLVEPSELGVAADGSVRVLLQHDGADGHRRLLLLRVDAAGRVDRTFGGAGGAVLDAGTDSDSSALALAVAPDGTATIAASVRTAAAGDDETLYVRRTAAGALDPGFGAGGTARVKPAGLPFTPRALAARADGSVIVAGTADPAPIPRLAAVFRLRADGTADPGYGAAGIRGIDVPGAGRSDGVAIATADDGSVAVAALGIYAVAPQARGAVARLDAAGALVPGFGTGGVAPVAIAGDFVPVAIAIAGDGSEVATAGRRTGGLGLVRLGADGGLLREANDADGGFRATQVRSATLAPWTGGGVLAFGWLTSPAPLAALRRDGQPDTALAGRGGLLLGADDEIEDARRLPDGRIVLAGRDATGGFVEVRRADGTRDPAFGGGDGRVALPAATTANALLVEDDGRIVVAGGAFAGTAWSMLVARITAVGALDPTFGGGDGLLELPYPIGLYSSGLPSGARHVAHRAGGGYVLVSSAYPVGGDPQAILAAATAAGAPDPAFGATGVRRATVPTGEVFAATTDALGRLLVAGGDRTRDFVLRLRADGSEDRAFGTGGVAVVAPPQGVRRTEGLVPYPDGSTVLVDLYLPLGGGIGLRRIARLDASGRMRSDRQLSLTSSGRLPIGLPDGRLLVPDRLALGGGGGESRVVRLLGPAPLAPTGVRRVSRARRSVVLSGRVDTRGLTGASLVVEVRRRGRFTPAGRVALPALVGRRAVRVRARGLAPGRLVSLRLVVVSPNGRAAGPVLRVRTRA